MANFLASPDLYRAVWRWHFYAGLIVAPLLFVLAVSGAIYLFNDEINDVLHRDLRIVPPASTHVPLSEMMAAALAPYPGGVVTRIDTPRGNDRSVEIFVTPAGGEPVRVFVDPGTGRLLGSYIYTHTLVGFADVAHGSLMLGKFGDGIVELAACWGFILMVTGLYLWWPRDKFRLGGVLYPRLQKTGRALWKDWHAVIGAWSALLIMFLILTGLPWANVWGDLLRRGTDLAGIGYPTSHRLHGASSPSTITEEASRAAPWTLQQVPMPKSDLPESDPHHHHGTMPASDERQGGTQAGPLNVDTIAKILTQQGMASPYRLTLPAEPSGVFTAFTYPDQPQAQRTLHIDQHSGRVLADIRFSDYG